MQIKIRPQWDTLTHLLEWLKFKRLLIPSAGKDVEQKELSYIAGGKCVYFGRVWQFLIKLSIHNNNPVIPLLALYPRETKIGIYMRICIWLLTYTSYIYKSQKWK
jgi:hypothetical protein